MLRPFLRAALVGILLLGTSRAFALMEGPAASRTGAIALAGKGPEPSCLMCHSANSSGIPPGINDPSGSLHLINVPPVYVPGATYSISLVLQHAWDPFPLAPPRWGFQLQAVSVITGDSAGAWAPLDGAPPDSFHLKPGVGAFRYRRYIEHTQVAIREGDSTGAQWDFQWTAPPTDIGQVYFFAAGNSANGDYAATASGDFIFTTVDSTFGPGIPTGVAPPPLSLRTSLEPPYPNPMSKCTDLSFTIAHAGHVSIAVYDLQGRRVRTVLDASLAAGTYGNLWSGKRDDGSDAHNGLYFVRMSAPGLRAPIIRKVTLAR